MGSSQTLEELLVAALVVVEVEGLVLVVEAIFVLVLPGVAGLVDLTVAGSVVSVAVGVFSVGLSVPVAEIGLRSLHRNSQNIPAKM